MSQTPEQVPATRGGAPEGAPFEDTAQARLDDLARRIGEVRRRAEDALDDPVGSEGPHFHDSGARRPDLDDQTIAPPG